MGRELASFSAADYVVFAGIILGAAGIGLYKSLRGQKKSTSSVDFLLGGRQMTALPVAMSLTASFMSGITVIGTPAEAYRFGSAFWLFGFSYTIMSAITAEIFLPVFYRLNNTSAYEYLEMRFSREVRVIGTSLYILQTILYTGLVIYAPALALNQITGMNLWGVLVLSGTVCILYCTLGGIKAVIWTDVLQMVVMLTGFVAVIARGAALQGGLSKIWEDAGNGGRLKAFDFDPDPLRRHTVWTILFGGSIMWVAIYAINQSQVQRYISCKTLMEAKKSLYVNMVGLWVTVSLAMLSGLTMYSIYKDCDPLTNGDIRKPDQLLPYLVMDILAEYPGIPGLFVAAAYSGTLSTVSSSINALVAVTAEDFVLPNINRLPDKEMIYINMGLSVFFGVVCIGMAGLASVMGSVLQAALSIFGMISGPLLGLFVLGMFFRTSNATGGLAGLTFGLMFTAWVGIGGFLYPPLSDKANPLPLSIDGCNATTSRSASPAIDRPSLADSLYSISYLYLSFLGMASTVLSGLLVSIMTGGLQQKEMDCCLFVTKRSLICYNLNQDSRVHHFPGKAAFKVNMDVDITPFTDHKTLKKMLQKRKSFKDTDTTSLH